MLFMSRWRGRMQEIQAGKEDTQTGQVEIVGGSGVKYIKIRKTLLHVSSQY